MKENTRVVAILGSIALVLAVMGAASWWLLADKRPGPSPTSLSEPVEVWTQDQIDAAERAVSSAGVLDSCIERFNLRMNRYPRTLDELVTAPTDAESAQRWNGPYLHNANLLVDPWGHPYRIAAPGIHNQVRFDLWSSGPDGADGSHDDIGNW